MAPQFRQQDQSLLAGLNATGIANSGAAKADTSDLAGQQSAALAAGVAPLYQNALSQYGSIIGQMPGAQVGAYNNAIEQGYQGIQGLGSLAGDIFGIGGGGGGAPTGTGSGGGGWGQAAGAFNPYGG
jgi:hypothetical protein